MDPKPVEDDAGAQETIRQTQDRRVPDGLVGELHAANGRIGELTRQLEATLSDAEYDQAGRSEKLGQELRKAERELEELTQRIREATPPEAKGG